MFELKTIERPEIGVATSPVTITYEIASRRQERLRELASTDWVVVWGDREHFANMHYLTGYDPRFEEALLVLGPRGQSWMLVGNEGVLYSDVIVGPSEVVLCQTFSLMGQKRGDSPRLDQILRDLGIQSDDSVGLAGWKYVEDDESISDRDFWIPSYVVHAIEAAAPAVALSDVTWALIHPTKGLRAANEAVNIALLEYGAARASEAVDRIYRASRPGVTEIDAVSEMGYAGEQLSVHVTYLSGSGKLTALRSAQARLLEYGDALSTAVGYWGGLSCRAGLIAERDDEFVSRWASPYFSSVAKWYSLVREGVSMGDVHAEVREVLTSGGLDTLLNLGHMTGTDEWVHSGFYEGSTLQVASGMAFQCDVIPTGYPANVRMKCEDGLVIAGSDLRSELAADFPEVWQRIQTRRHFAINSLGLELDESLLPLSNLTGYYAPLTLSPNRVFARA